MILRYMDVLGVIFVPIFLAVVSSYAWTTRFFRSRIEGINTRIAVLESEGRHTDGISIRIAVLESESKNMESRLSRMEGKIDQVLQRLGHHQHVA